MDALEFLKEERRMCNSFDTGCVKCPLGDIGCCVSPEETDEEFEKEIVIVEQWSKEHPRKTRQSEFLKQFPNAKMGEYGDFIDICPKLLNTIYQCGAKRGQTCYECCKEYWGKVVE